MEIKAKTILIVEDSRAINELLAHSLTEQLKIDVISAFTMKQAEEIMTHHADDTFLAILDLNLPDAPNGEIVDYIQSLGIPIIVLTGSLSDNTHDAMMEKGVIDYVVKQNLNEIEYLISTVNRLRDNAERSILIVDDSVSSRAHIRTLLESHFYNIVEACDGADALDKLDEYDGIILIVTDYNMPKMDGIEFISKVREIYSRDELGIIGISASGGGMVSVKLLKAGANDFINRPFLEEEFYCRINQNVDANVNYRQMRDAATKDYLTGLYNRKYVFETGEKLHQNAVRNNITLMSSMIDIDHFKRINDEHGHYIGDQALKHVSTIIGSQLRKSDILARMGGEEFCILAVNVTDSFVESLLERIRLAVMNTPLIIEGTVIKMTISIGCCTETGNTLENMINDADSALYESKEGGRNKVTRCK